jgi:small conductance mechanosensitive channel
VEISLNEAIEKVVAKLDSWVELFITMLPNIAVSILLLILFVVLAKAGSRIFKKVFSKASHNKTVEDLFSTIIYYTILGIGIFIILGILQLDKAVTSLLAGVGVVGLALGFAFQDITANFISGIILAFRKPFSIGDVVEVNGIMGVVYRTTLRVSVIRTFQGQEVYLPNKDVLQNPIYNYSVLGKRRIDLAVGISYGEDLEKVESVVREAIGNMEGVIDKENMIFDYYEFGDSSINFNIRFWIDFPGQPGFLFLRNQAIIEIKRSFDHHDITIPFPIRTLDFGIKGGEKLSEMKLSLENKAAQRENNGTDE